MGIVAMILKGIIAVTESVERKSRIENVEETIRVNNIRLSKRVDGGDWTLGYDGVENKFYLFLGYEGEASIIESDYLVKAELVEDGETSLTSSLSLGRAVVGGLVAGGVGAVIGGTTKAQKQKRMVSSVSLVITTGYNELPYIELPFLNLDEPIDVKYQNYKNAYQNAYQWLKLFEVAMHKAVR